MDLFKRITGALAASMIGIVAVFLVIGGVVIMNVMLATVTERTREIGLRKSMGARRSDILLQFLTETAVMSGDRRSDRRRAGVCVRASRGRQYARCRCTFRSRR